MSVKIENPEKNRLKLEFEIDSLKFGEGLSKSYRKNVGRFNVPGFRKGKAPMNIVERFYGVEVLYDDAVNSLFQEAYRQAIDENAISPVSKPEIEVVQIGKGKDLILTAMVYVKPELGEITYKGLEAEYRKPVISEDDVEEELGKEVEKQARYSVSEDAPCGEGDLTVIDFAGSVGGEEFPGGKGEDQMLKLGSGRFIKGFEDQVAGHVKGDAFEVNVTFPEDYQEESLRGKDAAFKVTLKEVRKKELPTVDDDFAKDYSSFETLDEYKADIRAKITAEAEERAKNEFEAEVCKALIDGIDVELPEPMVDGEVDEELYRMDRRMQMQGLSLESYMGFLGTDVEAMRAQRRPKAERDIKMRLAVERVAAIEGITADDDEVMGHIREMTEKGGVDHDEFVGKMDGAMKEGFRKDVAHRKAYDLIIGSAVRK